jgi:hypothetical protein
VRNNLKKASVKVGAQLQGGDAKEGYMLCYVKDLMYDGPLRNVTKLQKIMIPGEGR